MSLEAGGGQSQRILPDIPPDILPNIPPNIRSDMKTGDAAVVPPEMIQMTPYGGMTRIRLKGRSSITSSQPTDIGSPVFHGNHYTGFNGKCQWNPTRKMSLEFRMPMEFYLSLEFCIVIFFTLCYNAFEWYSNRNYIR